MIARKFAAVLPHSTSGALHAVASRTQTAADASRREFATALDRSPAYCASAGAQFFQFGQGGAVSEVFAMDRIANRDATSQIDSSSQ